MAETQEQQLTRVLDTMLEQGEVNWRLDDKGERVYFLTEKGRQDEKPDPDPA